MPRHSFAALILLAAIPLAVSAAETMPDPNRSAATNSSADTPQKFKELDTNHDGQISQREAKPSSDLSGRFSAIDTDKDKQISLPEWLGDEKSKSRGAAGVSGESRDPGGMNSPSTTPEKAGDAPRAAPGTRNY